MLRWSSWKSVIPGICNGILEMRCCAGGPRNRVSACREYPSLAAAGRTSPLSAGAEAARGAPWLIEAAANDQRVTTGEVTWAEARAPGAPAPREVVAGLPWIATEVAAVRVALRLAAGA